MEAKKNHVYNELMEFERTIYNIMKGFEKQLDNDTFDMNVLDHSLYHVSKVRFIRYLEMLQEAGFIQGINIVKMSNGALEAKAFAPMITLKGLEYLADNSMMKKVTNILKGGANITISAASSVLP